MAVSVSMFAACATLPSEIGRDATYVVAFKSSRLPSSMAWYVAAAEHGWFDVRNESGWFRVEILGRSTGVMVKAIDDKQARGDVRFGDRQAHVIKVYEGESARVSLERRSSQSTGSGRNCYSSKSRRELRHGGCCR